MARVLIVDDERDTVESFAMLLKEHGHEIRKAYDGESVLQQALGFEPHVVLLDLGLPGIDGFEVARRLRRYKSLAKLKIVAVTGLAAEEYIEKCKEAGIDAHFAKPLRFTSLKPLLDAADMAAESPGHGDSLPKDDA